MAEASGEPTSDTGGNVAAPAGAPASGSSAGTLAPTPPGAPTPRPGMLAAGARSGVAPAQDRSAFAEPAYRGSGSDFDFMRDMQQAMVNDRQWGAFLLLALVFALLGCAAVWASSSRLEEITKGDARIIPSSREQVIQSLEGGILNEMMVREGDIVTAGQPLLRIDETKARSSYQEGYSKAISLKAAAARLRAESRGTPLVFPLPPLLVPAPPSGSTSAPEQAARVTMRLK